MKPQLESQLSFRRQGNVVPGQQEFLKAIATLEFSQGALRIAVDITRIRHVSDAPLLAKFNRLSDEGI